MAISACPNCSSKRLFRAKKAAGSGGGYAPDYLPGLGSSIWRGATFDVVVCQDCGLTRLFASPEARGKLPESDKWERV